MRRKQRKRECPSTRTRVGAFSLEYTCFVCAPRFKRGRKGHAQTNALCVLAAYIHTIADWRYIAQCVSTKYVTRKWVTRSETHDWPMCITRQVGFCLFYLEILFYSITRTCVLYNTKKTTSQKDKRIYIYTYVCVC